MRAVRTVEIFSSPQDDSIDQPGAAETGERPETVPVLTVASEMFPLIKTGGLADVIGALPRALKAHGVHMKVLLPAYPAVRDKCGPMETVAGWSLLGEDVTLLAGHIHDTDILLLDCPALFDRKGGPYLDDHGRDHHDNWRRFAILSLAGARVAAEGIRDWRPALVHLHDWQTALTACYLRAEGLDIPTVLTIHNLAFQGQFPIGIFSSLGLPEDFLNTDCLEYYGDLSYLKGGICLSDVVTTVSPAYAREILTEEQGMGMAGVLRSRRTALSGIVNGIDQSVWNPQNDPALPRNYDIASLDRRQANRAAVERRFGLTGEGPIVGVISRLTWQKGIDMLAPVVPGLIDRGARLVVIGDGDPGVIQPLIEQVRQNAGRVAVQIGYSEEAAHLLHAGCDIILQPSRFEPCGLTQLYALRYGAVPVVARTGGLGETVIDANEAATAAGAATGFHFQPGSVEDLFHALDRALVAFERPEQWQRLQMQAMKTDFGWRRSAERYAELYRELLPSSRAAGAEGRA